MDWVRNKKFGKTILPAVIAIFLLPGCNGKDTVNKSISSSPRLTELMSMAQSLEGREEIDSSLMTYQEAMSLVDSLGIDEGRAFVLGEIGKLYLYRKGIILKAEEYLIKQRDLLESTNEFDVLWKINNYVDLSFLYLKKLDLPFAKSYSMLAYHVAKENNVKDSFLLSEIFSSLGNVMHQSYDSLDAIQMFRRAASYHTDLKDGKRSNHSWMLGLINVYNNSGPSDSARYWLERFYISAGNIQDTANYERLVSIYYYVRKNYPESLQHAINCTHYFRLCKQPDPYDLVQAYEMLSADFQYNGQYEEALLALDTSLFYKFQGNTSLTSLQSDIYSIRAIAIKAEILGEQGISLKDTNKIIAAFPLYDTLEVLLKFFTKMETDGFLNNKFFNNFYYTKSIELYSFMYQETGQQRWLYRIHDILTSYKAESFLREGLLSSLYQSDVGKNPLFKKYIENDQKLERVIFESENLLFEESSDIQLQINSLLREKYEIMNALTEQHPEIFNQLVNLKNISADEILAYTKTHDVAFINYYMGDAYYNADKIYVLVASNGEFRYNVLSCDHLVWQYIDSLYVANRRITEQDFSIDTNEYNYRNHFVFRSIFEPIYADVRGSKGTVIIPDGKLHLLSFESLLVELPANQLADTAQFSDYHYLIDSLSISYTYSPNRFSKSEKDPVTYKLNALGMGFSSKETIRERKLDFLPEIRSSYLELEALKKFNTQGKSKYFEGFDCTKIHFLKFGPDARLIHLSTHGGFLDSIKRSGMIYMSLGAGVEAMYQHELRFSGIAPEVIVLSACDSGAGDLNNEEGMMSIGRIFQANGTEKVISALWPLTDRASTDLFNSFYRNYFIDKEASQALRKAKLELLHADSKYNFPGYWAGVVEYN